MSDTQTEAEAAPTEQEPTASPTVEEELEQIITSTGGSAVDPRRAVDQLLDEALDIVEYMKPVDKKNKRRIRIYLLLAAAGVTNKEIADYLGVTPESVRQALLKARRGRDGS